MEPETQPDEKPAEKPPAEKPKEKPAEEAKVSLTATEYADLLRRNQAYEQQLKDAESKRQAELEAERKESLKKLAEKEGAEKALQTQAEQLKAERDAEIQKSADVRNRLLADKVDTELALALASKKLVSEEAAPQLLSLLAAKFETVEKDGRFVVLEKGTGKAAREALASLLAGKTYAHFFLPDSKGGSGSGGTNLEKQGGDKEETGKLGVPKEVIEKARKAMNASDNSFGL